MLKAWRDAGELETNLALLPEPLKSELERRWAVWARPEQKPPEGDWTNWIILGGRGSGKTRAGAEWVRAVALGISELVSERAGRIALVGETYGDARETMVEGQSGLLAIHADDERPEWLSSRRRLEWPNGAIAQVFSAEDAQALRGPQFGAAWCDELAKWPRARDTWDMLQFGMRLGDWPRQVVTTTPKPLKLLKDLLDDPRSTVTRMKTDDNLKNLARGFFESITTGYAETRLGRQELDGELIEDRPDALWEREVLDRSRAQSAPSLRRVVVAVDPPVTGTETSDRCGIIIAGRAEDGRAYVLADWTIGAVSPARWARRTVEAYEQFEADLVVIETNQGGDMAESVLRMAAPSLPVRQVKASRGKYLRAEPVALLYERGLVSHVGSLPQLEDEMCDFGLDGLSDGRSPDRLDALVWALTDLMLRDGAMPRARSL